MNYVITKDLYTPEEMEQPGGEKCLLCGETVGYHYQQADGMLYCTRPVNMYKTPVDGEGK